MPSSDPPARPSSLRRLEAASLFLIPLDRRRERYRYHALFREFLLGELRRTEPGIIVTLHQRAADWYEANGSPALALEHLLHTTDWDRSVRLAARLVPPTYTPGSCRPFSAGCARSAMRTSNATHRSRCWLAG